MFTEVIKKFSGWLRRFYKGYKFVSGAELGENQRYIFCRSNAMEAGFPIALQGELAHMLFTF